MSEKKLSPFDFMNNLYLGNKSEDLMKDVRISSGVINDEEKKLDSIEKQYNAFIINRGFSMGRDTILLANEMNSRSFLSSRMQYDFYRNLIRPGKRWNKWFKSVKSEDLDLIQEAYSCSKQKAREIIEIFTPEALKNLRKKFDKGGTSRKK
jgi:hypothetical protein